MRHAPSAFALILLMVLAPPCVARDPDHSPPVASAMAVLDEFMQAFNSRDMDAWTATLNYPHIRFASGEVMIWADADAYAAQDVFAALEGTGWDHSHWISRTMALESASKVHLDSVFQRFNSANEPIGTYRSLYIVTRNVDGSWGIQARSSLAP